MLAAGLITAQEPTAIISSDGDTSFCVSGQARMKIAFTGSAPYGYAFKSYPVENPDGGVINVRNNPINIEDLTDGYWIETVSVNKSTVYELVEVYDGSLPQGSWVYGQGYTNVSGLAQFQVDSIPEPNAGDDITEQCGYEVQLVAIPEDALDSVYWSSMADGSFSDISISNPVFTANTDKEYVFTFNEVRGACLGSDDVSVTFLGSPTGDLSGDTIICSEGELSVQVALQGRDPWTYSVASSVDTITRENISSNADNFNIPVSGNRTYRFNFIEDVNGCRATESQLSGSAVCTDNKPLIGVGNDQVSCINTTEIVGDKDKGDGKWFTAYAGVTIDNPTNETTSVSIASVNTVDHVSFKWRVEYEGCADSTNTMVSFAKPPTFSLQKYTDIICEDDGMVIPFEMEGNKPWILDYTDGVNNFSDQFDNSPASISVMPVISTSYLFLKIVGSYGCETLLDSLFLAIVEPKVEADAGEDLTFERKYTAQLSGTPTNVSGVWELLSGRGFISDSTLPDAEVSGLSVGANVFKWTVSPEVCPSSSDEVIITVNKYTSYNGFSPLPTTPGKNDYFIIDGATADVTNELIVVDQAGQVVFQQKNYDNDWDGSDMSGNPLDAGTYYYIFTSDGDDPIKDYVVIRRSENQ